MNRAATARPVSGRRGRQAARQARARRQRLASIGVLVALLAGVGVLAGLAVARGRQNVAVPVAGKPAPDGAFTTAGGEQETVASLQGRPTLLWFVATWCDSCQAGTQVIAQHIAELQSRGVRVAELELYRDLGQSGPDIASFAQQWAGTATTNPDWTWGEASAGLSHTYDPKAYLDIYYLLDAHGTIRYVNSSPGATLGAILDQAARLQ